MTNSVRDPGQPGQLSVEQIIASAIADKINEALREIIASSDRKRAAEVSLGDAALTLDEAMRGAAIEGASVRQIAAAAGLGRTATHRIVAPYLVRRKRR